MHIQLWVNFHWFLGLLVNFFGSSVLLEIADHMPQGSLKLLPKNDIPCSRTYFASGILFWAFSSNLVVEPLESPQMSCSGISNPGQQANHASFALTNPANHTMSSSWMKSMVKPIVNLHVVGP